MQPQFLGEFTNQGFGIPRDDAEGVATLIGRAGRAQLDDNVACVFARTLLIETAIFQELGGKRVVSTEGRGSARDGSRGHGQLSFPIDPVGQMSSARWAESSSSGVSGCLKK